MAVELCTAFFTHNICTWVSNLATLRRTVKSLQPFTADQARSVTSRLFNHGFTPDGVDVTDDSIDWKAVAGRFNEY